MVGLAILEQLGDVATALLGGETAACGLCREGAPGSSKAGMCRGTAGDSSTIAPALPPPPPP